MNVPSVVDEYRNAHDVLWASQPVYAIVDGRRDQVEMVLKRPLWHFIFVQHGKASTSKRYYFTYDASSGLLTKVDVGSIGRIGTKGVPLWRRSGDASL